MKKLLVILGLVSASFTGVRLASAGWKRVNPIYVSAASRMFYGDMGSIRASADGNQRLYCEAYYWTTSTPEVQCAGWDAAGNYATCISTNPLMVTAAAAVKGDSGVFVSYDASGNCTTIDSYSDSAAMPKVN